AVARLGYRAWMCASTRGESRAQCPLAIRREQHDARIRCALRPSEIDNAIQKRRAQRPGEMVTAFAPIETCPAERALPAGQAVNVDAQLEKHPVTDRRQRESIGTLHQSAFFQQAFVDGNADLASEMVVADSCLSQCGLTAAP